MMPISQSLVAILSVLRDWYWLQSQRFLHGTRGKKWEEIKILHVHSFSLRNNHFKYFFMNRVLRVEYVTLKASLKNESQV